VSITLRSGPIPILGNEVEFETKDLKRNIKTLRPESELYRLVKGRLFVQRNFCRQDWHRRKQRAYGPRRLNWNVSRQVGY
jgi:hypothetical protein